MKIILFGASGQLGQELQYQINNAQNELVDYHNADIVAPEHSNIDISSLTEVKELFAAHTNVDMVFNCAAFTRVDECENQIEKAMSVNAVGAQNIAQCCNHYNATLVHISTDYVFDGTAKKPYTESDLPNPRTIYGRSKYQGEQYIRAAHTKSFILRTSWLFGKYGHNFVDTILKLASEKQELTVVGDQYGTPTAASDLADHMLRVALTQEYGLYHCSGHGVCSWFELASKVIEYSNKKCKVIPCTSQDYPQVAERPHYSALDNFALQHLGLDRMREWPLAIKKHINGL